MINTEKILKTMTKGSIRQFDISGKRAFDPRLHTKEQFLDLTYFFGKKHMRSLR